MGELQIIGLRKDYGSPGDARHVRALDAVTLSLVRGEILAVLGLNGAGKTTLVKILSGLITPDEGEIRYEGINSTSDPRFLRRIGVVFEGNRNIYWRLTTFENLEYFGVLRGLSLRKASQSANAMLKRMNLEHKREVIAAHLSRGMQQRLAIGISLVHDPQIILLDEPTLGVDLENVLQIVDILKALARTGVTIILTSHQLDVVKMLADRIALLVRGRLAALETRSDFLARADRSIYTVSLLDPLDDNRRSALTNLGVVGDAQELRFSSGTLYETLRVLQPLRIASLTCGADNFMEVFLERVREHDHA